MENYLQREQNNEEVGSWEEEEGRGRKRRERKNTMGKMVNRNMMQSRIDWLAILDSEAGRSLRPFAMRRWRKSSQATATPHTNTIGKRVVTTRRP